MAKDLEEALVNNPKTKLGGAEKPHMDLGAHLEYIESLLEHGGHGGGGSVDLLKPIINEGNAPVPNTGYLEKFFFNTKLTTDQVDSIIVSANLNFIDAGDGLMLYPILGTDTNLVIILDCSSILGTESGSSWAIGDILENCFYYVSSAAASATDTAVGWNESTFTSFDTGEVNIGADLKTTSTNDIKIGLQNNLLTALVSSTLFEEKTEVVKSLTDQYKLVEENITLDTEVNSVYTYDFVDSINEDTKEINIIKTIAVRSKETNIIDKTITTYTNNIVSQIGSYAFYKCMNLTDVNLPRAHDIETYAFSECSNLVNIDIPQVTAIHEYAFASCIRLVKINIPQAISIFSRAFNRCHALKTITGPLVDSISNDAFSECRSLIRVEFPKVSNVYSGAFLNNYKLTEVILSQITNIYSEAFYNCHSLIKLVISQKNSICKLENTNAFNGCYHILGTRNSSYNPDGLRDGYIYVPASLLSQYKVATNWGSYASQIIGHEDLEAGSTLPDYTTSSFTKQTWYSDEKLTTVVTSVTTTGRYYCRLEA